MKQRRKPRDYSVSVLRSRITGLVEETQRMGQDGRMDERVSFEVMALLMRAREMARASYETRALKELDDGE